MVSVVKNLHLILCYTGACQHFFTEAVQALFLTFLAAGLNLFRDIIRNAVNASEHDSVIFTGSGSTGTIHKLIHALNLKEPPVSTRQ